ncbi:MAG: ThiF family adenylyltransferase [Micrococcales bacterium]|nr:ThiF family adenylyltransferase [Micrococcales bacterium]
MASAPDREPLGALGPEPTAEQLLRYSRQVLLPGLGIEGQRRLLGSRVLVVGAGGLGSPALLYLAGAGVGTLGVIDSDVVDVTNLHRQVIHRAADEGAPKTASAASAVRALNPDVEVIEHRERLTPDNALRILSGYHLVLDGSDNFPTRYLVGDACGLLGIPHVWGSLLRYQGQASVWWAGHGPCYRCVFPAPPPPGSVPSCAEGGVLGPVCAAIGSIEAVEAVKLLTGIGEPMLGRLLLHDASTQTWDTLPVAADPQCPLCGEHPTIHDLTAAAEVAVLCGMPPARAAVDGTSEPGGASDTAAPQPISPDQLDARLADRAAGRDDFMLVDVRSPGEHAVASIPGSVLVPVEEVEGGWEPPRGIPLIVHCASGVRSARAAAALRARGHDVSDLGGGIEGWLRAQRAQR